MKQSKLFCDISYDSTQIFIQSISYKGCNNGLCVGLTNLMFDYCPIESELDFLDSFEEEGSSIYSLFN